jgi:hypothetical protein
MAALAIAAWPRSATAQAAPGLGAERLYWYQFVDVGLAVSASILGFMFPFRVLGKVTLKSRQHELQLREKAAVSCTMDDCLGFRLALAEGHLQLPGHR